MWFRTHTSQLRLIWLIQGILFGAGVFVAFAFVSTFLLNKIPEGIEYCPSLGGSACIPLTMYAFLVAASSGPAALLYLLTWPRLLTQLQTQAISGLTFSVLAGLSFLLAGRKWGVVIFLVTSGILTGITTFWIALAIFTG